MHAQVLTFVHGNTFPSRSNCAWGVRSIPWARRPRPWPVVARAAAKWRVPRRLRWRTPLRIAHRQHGAPGLQGRWPRQQLPGSNWSARATVNRALPRGFKRRGVCVPSLPQTLERPARTPPCNCSLIPHSPRTTCSDTTLQLLTHPALELLRGQPPGSFEWTRSKRRIT